MSRFANAVDKRTFTIPSRGLEYESKAQGHVAVFNRIAQYPGMDVFLEETLDGVIDIDKIRLALAKVKSGDLPAFTQKKVIEFVLTKLDDIDMSPGRMVAKVIMKFPGLAADILADGAILLEGETRQEFLDLIDSMTIPDIIDLGKQWYAFNLEGDIGPLVEKAKAKAEAQTEAAKPEQAKAAPRIASGFSRHGSK